MQFMYSPFICAWQYYLNETSKTKEWQYSACLSYVALTYVLAVYSKVTSNFFYYIFIESVKLTVYTSRKGVDFNDGV
jgi:hypothetical protein